MIVRIKKIFTKELILYVFFGVCTMILNTAAYALLYNCLHCANVFSTIVAWALAVIVAYITNRIWVFESKPSGFRALLKEFFAFLSCRIATGILDVIIMYVGVDICHFRPVIMKLLANVIVVIGNYIASKLWIFKE